MLDNEQPSVDERKLRELEQGNEVQLLKRGAKSLKMTFNELLKKRAEREKKQQEELLQWRISEKWMYCITNQASHAK